MMTSLKSNTVKELILICQNDKRKYRGYSKYKRKDDLINFISDKNIVEENPLENPLENQYNESNDDMGEILNNLFNEPDEKINVLFCSRPIKENIDENIVDIEKNIKHKNKKNSVVFDIHDDEGNGNMYRIYKHNYYKKYKKLGNELILYHGTNKKNIPDILEYGFSLTNGIKHGALYGKGIYFTNCIDKALSYSERGSSNKYVIVSVVHIGDIIKGNANMDMHPKIQNKSKRYDTSVDNIKNPIQYIKKENYTYNILGVLSFTLFNIISHNNYNNFSLRFNNNSNVNVSIYWIPDFVKNVSIKNPDIFKKSKFMHNSYPGGTWSCNTCHNHKFIYTYNTLDNPKNIISRILIIKKNTIIDFNI